MLRGYKNFNIAGSASGLGLLLLAFLLVNPLVGSSASALEGGEGGEDSGGGYRQARWRGRKMLEIVVSRRRRRRF